THPAPTHTSPLPLHDALPISTANLQDAIVYDTDDPDDAGLLVLLNPDQPQVNENGGGSGTTQSSQRCPNGSGGARNTSTYQQGRSEEHTSGLQSLTKFVCRLF